MICGWELNDTAEYTGATGLTVEDTYKYLSPYYAKLAASTGNVYWTMNYANTTVVLCSCHIRLVSSSHVKPIKLTRGGYEFSVQFDDSANETRTVTLKAAGSTFTYSYYVPFNSWIHVVMYVGYLNLGLYIDGNMLCDDHQNNYSGNTGTVTELKAEAISASGNSLLYIDDVAFFAGVGWGGQEIVVLPYIPNRDEEVPLTTTPANSPHWSVVDERSANDDTDYVATTAAGTFSEFYGSTMSKVSGLELSTVYETSALIRAKKTATGTGAETVCFILRVGDDGFGNVSAYSAVTTSYANYLLSINHVSGMNPPGNKFYDPNDNQAIQVGVRATSTATANVRVTQVRVCVGAYYIRSPYTGGASADIVGTGSWHMEYTVDVSAWSQWDYICTYVNVTCIPIFQTTTPPEYAYMGVKFYYTGSSMLMNAGAYKPNGSVHGTEYIDFGARRKFNFRFVGHDNFISVFESGRWIHTFSFTSVQYPSVVNLYVVCNRAVSITTVRAAELSDWREATYIDMQSSIASGISSVIQERPVETIPLQGGNIDFSYNRVRTSITPSNIYRHAYKSQYDQNVGSHYIVYYRDVAVVVDENYMDDAGYATRVLQLSQLEAGAVEAAKVIAQRARESLEKHSVDLAPDIRIEPGDRAVLSYTLSGTGTAVSKDIIVEDVNFDLSEGEAGMALGGRKYV